MFRRVAFVVMAVLVAAGAFGACSNSDDDDDDAASTTTDAPGTTVATTGTTPTTEAAPSPAPVPSEPVPPVTPPASLPAACELLHESAFPAAAIDTSKLVPDDRPDGVPAPSNGCRWEGTDPVALVLYYGQDPLESLAIARQNSPGGSDVTGVGQDAYFVTGVLFVDTGRQAFALSGGPTQEQLEALAQSVISNL